jgi:quercetin dioxygenase-like cupin family protein
MRRVYLAFLLLFPLLGLVSVLVSAQTAAEVEITAEPSHHLAIENEYVRVFKVEVGPRASTLQHRHRHDYLFVTLGNSDVENEVAGKAPVEIKLTDGETRFTPGNFAHAARNLSEQPFRNVTIELLQDEKSPQTRSRWPMEGGDKTFLGGLIKILFVRDGARVAENNLDPGATVPSHHHDGPHLLVAVSDLDLRSDVEGKGPMTRTLKAGDVVWVPGGYTHTLTNTGSRAVRFVTVEF